MAARLHDLLTRPDPGLQGALVGETDAVLRSIYVPGAHWGDFSRFELFPISRSQLLVVASRLSRLDDQLDDFLARRPHDEPTAEPRLDARFAEIFLGAWLCSNFSTEDWRPLLALDRSFIVLAAEYCIWVKAASGADGIDDFRRLVTQECLGPLRAHREVLLSPFAGATDSMDWRGYVDRLIASPST